MLTEWRLQALIWSQKLFRRFGRGAVVLRQSSLRPQGSHSPLLEIWRYDEVMTRQASAVGWVPGM